MVYTSTLVTHQTSHRARISGRSWIKISFRKPHIRKFFVPLSSPCTQTPGMAPQISPRPIPSSSAPIPYRHATKAVATEQSQPLMSLYWPYCCVFSIYPCADCLVCRLSECIRESLMTNEGGEEHDLVQNAPTKSPVQTKITDCLRKQ